MPVRPPWFPMILATVVASQLVALVFFGLCWHFGGGCQITAGSVSVARMH